MRFFIGCFFAPFLFLTTAFGDEFVPAEPSSIGIDPERLQHVDRAIRRAIENDEVPGAVAIIARKGKIGYHKSFGHANLEAGEVLKNDAIFRIASMTKAITSVAVMQLYEAGHFRLGDPVSKFIPEFKDPKVLVKTEEDGKTLTRPAKREITIRDLLTHTAGIGYTFIPSSVQEIYREADIVDGVTHKPYVLKDVIPRLGGLPLIHDPGEKWTYGLNTDVLGYLVEVVSGKPLDEYFQEHLFAPLGMVDTGFYLPEEKANRLVTWYRATKDGLKPQVGAGNEFGAEPDYPVNGARSYFSGGGGLSGTALDYARFIQMLLNEGELDGQRVLSRKSVELMRAVQVEDFGGEAFGFGLGFRVLADAGKRGELGSAGTYSWGGAFFTSYWIDPSEQLIAVLMCQVRPAFSQLGEQFQTAVYQALE
ncbi:MAG: serine hydrolase [Verrucomicrobiota bacterium]